MEKEKQLLVESPMPLEVVEREEKEERKEGSEKPEIPLPSKYKEAIGFGGPKPNLTFR